MFQEASLAAELGLICGSSCIQWQELSSLTQIPTGTDLIDLGLTTESARAGVRTVLEISHFTKRLPQHLFQAKFLGPLLACETNKACGLPVDHVYAMHGLFVPEFQQDVTDNGLISHSQPCWRAFVQFGKCCLEAFASLELLDDATSPNKHQSILSWCPDYSLSYHAGAGVLLSAGSHARSLTRIQRSKAAIEDTPGSDNISFRGFCVDQASHIVSPTPDWCGPEWDPSRATEPAEVAEKALNMGC